ncbi:protein shisa-3 homolog [Oppia nitens]|uniref:protein shisa-3 homolog n=1 Tax=Oppia nitens TaxID=1686743 RepID=UPI0023DC0891|nr:protein shisa-3 homolog [Oppia nitens]
MEVRELSPDGEHQVFGDDYCTGYVDQYNKWNTGFSCPTKSNEEAVYCCGTPTYKYCCTRRSQSVQTHTSHPTRTQLDPRILLKIIGLTCIVSVFLTILTCYVCKRYWKRSDSRDNQVYRVSCNSSASPHVFPLESFQPLNPAFFKSPEQVASALCGDLSVFSGSHPQPTQLRTVLAATRANPSAALCSYQHNPLLRHQRSHEPPPPYQLSVISGNSIATTSAATASSSTACISSGGNSHTNTNSINCHNNETQTNRELNSNCNVIVEDSNTEVKIPLSSPNYSKTQQQQPSLQDSQPQQSSSSVIINTQYHQQSSHSLRRKSQ